MREVDDSFKLKLLISSLRIKCHYFKADEAMCKLTENCGDDWHLTLNCYGDINKCDLPDRFTTCL